MPSENQNISEITDSLIELIRKEIPDLLASGINWKLIVNGNSAGDVSTVIEQHCQRVRRFRILPPT